ncbi:MAG: nucleoside triphosphate pyrophosphohydrolase [Fibrella sp.]|nr:nucleoside triphosphate pyrophosphohydrolase [Armatimonadota bacterium]
MLTILGLGPGDPDTLPARNVKLLRSGVPVLLRTVIHPTVESGPVREILDALPPGTVTALDEEYERGGSFDETYRAIVRRVLSAADTGDVVYAVPGHPLMGETTVALLLAETKARGIAVRIFSAPSFVDACLELLQVSVDTNLHVVDALTLRADAPAAPHELRTGGPLLLYQVHSRRVASETKLSLMNAGFPDDFAVSVIHAAGIVGQEAIRKVPLHLLDRTDAGVHNHLTSVFIPSLPGDSRKPSYFDLVHVMARLRDKKNGCPWDLKQSHDSLRKYVIEEAYEVAEAIDRLADDSGSPDDLCDELGDLLLQVVFHAQLAKEAGDFDESDVCTAIVEKLIRRHPHIFGEVIANDAETVLTNWNAIKAQEKRDKSDSESDASTPSVLDGVNQSLPALLMALETSKRAVKVGFEWANTNAVLAKVDEELAELRAELSAATMDTGRVESEIGDLLFTLVNVARRTGVNPEDALRRQITRFGGRFRFMEQETARSGQELSTLTPDAWFASWKRAKENERKVT